MPTLIADPLPAEIERLIARRHQRDTDRRDEVWEGVLHMNPPASTAHEQTVIQLALGLAAAAKTAGLELTGAVGIGDQDDYRVPDLAAHRPPLAAQWHSTCALAVEVLSPGDETYSKLGFYAAHHVDELLIVDPAARTVDWRALRDGAYQPVESSRLIDLSAAQLVEQIAWPT